MVLPRLTIDYRRSQKLDRASIYLYKPSSQEAKRINSSMKRSKDSTHGVEDNIITLNMLMEKGLQLIDVDPKESWG
jgi:hypothetical protein